MEVDRQYGGAAAWLRETAGWKVVEEDEGRSWNRMGGIDQALAERYRKDKTYPVDETSLQALLSDAGIGKSALLDPWETPIRFQFDVVATRLVMTAKSAGPDKKFDTADDLVLQRQAWPYFEQRGALISQAVWRSLEKPGVFIRDLPSLRNALRQMGEDIDAWKDPNGRPFRYLFDVNQGFYTIQVLGHRTNSESEEPSETALIFETRQNYAPTVRQSLQEALNRYFRETSVFPETQAQFEEAPRPSSDNDRARRSQRCPRAPLPIVRRRGCSPSRL
jgi:hypothetical protein